MSVKIIKGGSFTDGRGMLNYVNDFQFTGVKRFYQVTHPHTSIVRAWQGHRVEHKWFYVGKGSFLLAWVKIDNWDNPSPALVAEHTILSADEPAIISLPNGYANGIKALEPGSILTIFSDRTVEESANDNLRFDASLWMNWETGG